MSDEEIDSVPDGEIDDDNEGAIFQQQSDIQLGGVGKKRKFPENGLVPFEKAGQKKRKLQKKNELKKLQKPPTVEELNRLRETENLFHSNLFRRQIEEMLKELEVKNKYKVRVNMWFDKFKEWIFKMEDKDENLDYLENLKVKLPIAMFSVTEKDKFYFRKPIAVKIIGSYLLKTLLGTGNIDILVVMPKRFFDKEDYLNGRYYRKRAVYLCELANHLLPLTDLVEDLKFSCNAGDDWRPVLEVTPPGKLNKKTKFIVHLTAEKGSFRLNRFVPNRNNVRSRWFFGENAAMNDEECPTPEYNCGVLRDLRCEENEEHLAGVLEKSTQLRDAVILLKVWARQRELHVGYGAFTGHLLAFLVAYLLQIRKLNLAMSSYQITRTVWSYLTMAKWDQSGITMYEDSPEQVSMSDFHQHFPLVFVDLSGFLNLTAGMSELIFRRCQDEAAFALRCLDTTDMNCFQIIFMTPVPFSRLCDQYIVFPKWTGLEKVAKEHSSNKKKLDLCGLLYPQVRDLIVSLLRKGFGTRVSSLYIHQVPPKSWAVHKKPPKASSLTVGLLLDPENCFSVVDKGPIADAEEAEKFRDFWKDRSELRRFKDGSITESVLWDAKTWQEKRMICRQVANYLLKEKFNLNDSDFHYVGDEIEVVLPKDREMQTSQVASTFEQLMKDLRGLKDLPLDVISVQGASSVFRSSDVFPPTLPPTKAGKVHKLNQKPENIMFNCAKVDLNAHIAPSWCAPASVVIQLGSSNKWPHDLEAVRRIRAAFNIKISQLLTDNYGYVTQAYPDEVDVLTDTCVFRLHIVYPGEVALMKKTIKPDGLLLYRDTEESRSLERSTTFLPKLTSALNGLQSQHSAFGPACSLAQRWVRSHLFHETHISDEAIDLLMASVFVNPAPWQTPNQPQLAFLRFLSLIAHTNWSIELILLNFNEVLSKDEKHEIESYFDNNRSTLPSVFIATPDDRMQSVWTRDGPCPVVLLRLVQLAHRALLLLESQLLQNTTTPDFLAVFQPSLAVFDVLIHLVAGLVPKSFQGLKNIGRSITQKDNRTSVIPVVGFDPVDCYIKELTESYGEWALFFYDSYGGSTIGVLWRPGSHQPREFKVSHLHGRRFDRSNNTLLLDKKAILEGFNVLGRGLVKSIQFRDNCNHSFTTLK